MGVMPKPRHERHRTTFLATSFGPSVAPRPSTDSRHGRTHKLERTQEFEAAAPSGRRSAPKKVAAQAS